METNQITEKVYCYDHPAAYRNNDNSMCYAMMANQNNMNNPMWLVWMMAMRWMYGNGYGEYGYGQNAQLSALQNQVSDNQSFNNLMNQLTQNQNLMQDFANRTNTNIDFVRQSLCELKSAVQNVVGETKFSAERVINAVNMGDCNVIQALKDCCCQTQQLVQRMGYENQLAQKDNIAAMQKGFCDLGFGMQSGFDRINTGLERGFAQVGYETQKQTCDIINAGKDNTQRIIDVLNNHWQADLQQRYNDARLELSQKTQNEYLINQLKKTCCQ